MTLSEKSILILLGGMWHDFDGFANIMKPIFEAEGCHVKATYDLDFLTHLENSDCDLVLSYTCLFKHRQGYDDVGPEKLTDEQVHGLTRWVQSGGGLLSVHAATVIGYSDLELGRLFGGVFLSHPEPFKFSIYPLSGEHPITSGILAFDVYDEFYIQKYDPSVKIHMVATYQNVAYPMAWSKPEVNGRVAHISPGHFPEVWINSAYQRLMLQTADWLTNR